MIVLKIFEVFGQFPQNFPLLETILSGCVAFFLGIFWYHPKVMGNKWTEAMEVEKSFRINPFAYVIAFFMWIISASIYSFLTGFLNPPSIDALLGLSTFLWVGFVLPSAMMNGLFGHKKLMVIAVDSSYYLAGLYLFAVIHDVL